MHAQPLSSRSMQTPRQTGWHPALPTPRGSSPNSPIQLSALSPHFSAADRPHCVPGPAHRRHCILRSPRCAALRLPRSAFWASGSIPLASCRGFCWLRHGFYILPTPPPFFFNPPCPGPCRLPLPAADQPSGPCHGCHRHAAHISARRQHGGRRALLQHRELCAAGAAGDRVSGGGWLGLVLTWAIG